MAIPKIQLPLFKIFLVSLNKEINYRPFLVKEEKMLLMAAESNDPDYILNTTKQIVRNCIIDENIDVESLPLFDFEYLFLMIRAKSMGEIVELKYICQNEVEGKKCKGNMIMNVDLTKVNIEVNIIDNNIKLTDSVGIKLKYPTIEISKVLNNNKEDLDTFLNVIKECTEYLYDETQVYKPNDMTEGEFEEFIEKLSPEQLRRIQNFFYNAPTLKHTQQVNCSKCGKEHKIVLEGILDFFA